MPLSASAQADVVSLTVVEAGGGCPVHPDRPVRVRATSSLPTVEVDQRGNPPVPLRAKCRRAQVQAEIEAKLSNRAIDPQIVLAIQE